MLISLLQVLQETFPIHMHICIDGSQIPSVSEYAVTGNILNNSIKIHPKTPILDCELNAIEHAVDPYVHRLNQELHYLLRRYKRRFINAESEDK